ncbi:MAG: alpha/beta hydrolase, partial [Gemmatimonadaceae bacterium]|nr:alpha/beta hydrolase [Gemmatimonadaceae bacterium]
NAIVNGVSIWYEDSGGDDKVPGVFSHGLLLNGRMFEPQVEALKDRYRCIRYDHRGQGRSSSDPGWRPHDIENLYRDAINFLETTDLRPVHWVGFSTGGFVGMRLAARRPDLVSSLTLLDTSAEAETHAARAQYQRLTWAALALGPKRLVNRIMPVLFGKSFLTDPTRAAEVARWREEIAANSRMVVRAVWGVLERESVLDELREISTPTLVVVGEEDVATVPTKSRRIHASIHGSVLVRLPRCGHSSSIEQPAEVSRLLREFLDGIRVR